ncbi:hypothetical protein COR50_02170 [Chitinophaga caeni]|uniref:FecR protein domain-containing protein n=1 Tax=Chitinophaga caeni TaxID=2029983 RepID=A0A291QQ92_9BACT|nr:FecR domain-containing protein [Chitinophaga caeni]ATL46063.1 hypothetical protein COR50_02170 [Chitinophaga caeni]
MKPFNEHIFKELLIKHRKGNLSLDEAALLDDWFEHLQVRKGNWYVDEEDKKNQLELLWQQIDVKTRSRDNRFRYTWYSAAAIILGMACFTFWPQPKELPHARNNATQATTEARQMLVYTCPIGATRVLRLPDQSRITLNSGATIRYPVTFSAKIREVELVAGQAYFDIKSQPDIPFQVKSKWLSTVVLGTSFEIRLHKNDRINIAVNSGKVRVSRANQKVVLEAGKQLYATNDQQPFRISDIPPEQVGRWQKGQWRLESASFRELSDAFEVIYGIPLITNNESVSGQTYNIILNYHTPMKDMVAVLAAIHNNDFIIQEDSVVLISKYH